MNEHHGSIFMKRLNMFCILLSAYFVGLLSPVLVYGYGYREGCQFNQTIIAKEESTAVFLVNFTQTRLLRLQLWKAYRYFRRPKGYFPRGSKYFLNYVAEIIIDSKGIEHTLFFEHTWETRANISIKCYSDDDICNVRIDLNNVSMKDNGTYKLLYRHFEEVACFTLFILRGPSDPLALVPRKKHHYLLSGDILPNITCTSECNPPCNISWGENSKENTLSLGAVTTEETREYTCTATRVDGQAVEQTISIYVAARPSHHLVLVPAQIYYNLVAGDLMPDITCTSDCNQPCFISWGKHGRGKSLSLGAVTTETTGEYTCTARRSDGENVKQSIFILVTDNSFFIQAIACLGIAHAITFFVIGLIIFFVYKRREPFCRQNRKHDDIKRNKPDDANITFSKSTIQVCGNENYEDLKDETRNINNIYSEVNQAIIEDLTQQSADIYENTLNSKKNKNVLQE